MSDKSGTQNKDSNALGRKMVLTDDGSVSIEIPEMNEMYHSRKGAIKESQHVYIENGLYNSKANPVEILEIGMGTGLNVFLTYLDTENSNRKVQFDTLEPYPLTEKEWKQLNYAEVMKAGRHILDDIHSSVWESVISLGEHFTLTKFGVKLEEFDGTKRYDVIYFDAFAPNKQQNPWQLSNIQKCHRLLKPGGVLVTYCSQGQFKRDLAACGFTVTNPEGPMGKREITVAFT